MKLSEIELHNWKNFLQLDLKDIKDRLFIVGPNASGKSNFLDALRFLRDIVSVGGGFQDAVRKRNGLSSIRCLAARRYPNISISAQLDDGATSWNYSLEFAQDNQRNPVIRREIVTKNGKTLVKRPDDDDRDDLARLTQTYLEQVNVNKKFREVASFFQTVDYLHIVPQLVREPDRSVGKKQDPFGGDFLERLASTPKRTLEPRLTRIQRALTVAVPQLEKLELVRDERNGTPHLRGKYSHWRPQGSWQQETQFSDGTLRLIGLLWATLDGSGPLLLEEPELSLHSEVVRFLPRMFAKMQQRTGRQVFVSTHSEEILSDEDVGPEEVVILTPGENGTQARVASEIPEVMAMYKATGDLTDAVVALTAPKNARQLPVFAEG